ncbi:hypothetical protein [Bradyrhizobium sp. ERR14]|uniref:hypothetical protein n=1 Tax=Bradyrhizobium sp. ERR14 TaxID=2663837 RepID=UPI00161DDAB5|nr:hypothetical protein [Bradyrhizobium sp. ERR14]MBB4391800.1 putative membrane protein [Bradyrhizobium sp. ERR14]
MENDDPRMKLFGTVKTLIDWQFKIAGWLILIGGLKFFAERTNSPLIKFLSEVYIHLPTLLLNCAVLAWAGFRLYETTFDEPGRRRVWERVLIVVATIVTMLLIASLTLPLVHAVVDGVATVQATPAKCTP